MNYKLLNLEDFDEGSDAEKRMADTMLELDGTVEAVETLLGEFSPVGNSIEPLLKEASTLRKNYLKDIFEDHQVVEINHSVTPEEHRKFMASVMIRWINNWGKDDAAEFTRSLDEEAITTGRLSKDMRVLDKTFREGSKTTRVFNHFAESTNDYTMKTRLVGNFQPQEGNQTIRLLYSPWAILHAGEMSASCVSPEGENEHSVPTALGYKNMFVAMDDKLRWRAWVFVDPATKTYNIGKGYPRENYEAQHAVMAFMRDKGYEIPNGERFYTPEYTDQAGIFDRVYRNEFIEFVTQQEERLNLPKFVREKDVKFDEGRESEHDWQGYLNSDYKDANNIITLVTHCEWCDRTSLWGDGGDWCGYCEQGTYCDSCEEVIYYESEEVYSPARDEVLCQSCYDMKITEEKDTVRMEHTAAYIYKFLEKFFVDEGGDEQYLTNYYEEMPDTVRDDVMWTLTQWVVHDDGGYGLRNALTYKNQLVLTEKNEKIFNENQFAITNEIIDFYQYRWIDGDIEV